MHTRACTRCLRPPPFPSITYNLSPSHSTHHACLQGYGTYITIMYVMIGIVLAAVAGVTWLTLAMRRQDQPKWLKGFALLLFVVYDVVFGICYVSFFDYMVFTANCNFGQPVKNHVYFESVSEWRRWALGGAHLRAGGRVRVCACVGGGRQGGGGR